MTDRHGGDGDLGFPDMERPPAYIEGMGGGPAMPTQAPKMSQAEKGEYEDVQDIFATAAKVFAAGATAAAIPTGGTVSVVLGTLAVASTVMSIIAGELADDPPRPDYARPVVFKQRESNPSRATDPALAPMRIAIQQVVFGAVTGKGYLDAIERLQGAYNANDLTWTTAHRGIANLAFRQLIVDLANNGAALNAAAKALKGSQYDLQLAPGAGSVKQWIETQGVQAALTSELKASGFTPAEIKQGITFLKSDPTYVGPTVQLSGFISETAKKVYASASKLNKLA